MLKNQSNKLNLILITASTLFLDQITKYIVNKYYIYINSYNNLLFSIKLVRNNGAAFNILSSKIFFLSFFSLISTIIITYVLFFKKNINPIDKYGLSFILAGCIGNGIDRIRNGFVIDFINLNFISFPVFNIADVAINIGFFIILYNLINKKN
tara:strand:+ start:23 stop:481 length:459 start_codon:yes stop_codon:yes gene_type:complete